MKSDKWLGEKKIITVKLTALVYLLELKLSSRQVSGPLF